MRTRMKATAWTAWIAALGLAAMATTGCLMSGQDGAMASASTATWIAGRAQADDSASLQGDVVTTQEVDSTGLVGPVVDSAVVEADGSFRVRTRLRGVRFLVIRIVHHGKVLKARLEDRIDAGDSINVGDVNGESTVETEVRIRLRATAEGRAALSSEIRAAIATELNDSGLVAFRGDSTACAQVIARLEAAVRASASARVEAVADLVRRAEAADSARPDSTRPPRPRADLSPCAKAALLIAAMDPSDTTAITLKAVFAANCLVRDTVRDDSLPPPPPPSCSEAKARLEVVGTGSAEGAALSLDLAARCDSIAPPDSLKPCERAAIRLAAMATTDPGYVLLRAAFQARCLDDDTSNDAGVLPPPPSGAGASVRVGK